ncbi:MULTISPECIES: hypothetical protein [unclassified Bacillus (in: firmicutes)]|uniref:hypothetical protein n=1 Tax=unclassified Bacillus (in: firmicutes) TaxID=185979 RepID=UPI0035C89C5D
MRKQTLKGRILYGFGVVLFVWGLIMLNIISDIAVFENVNKSVGGGVLILGIICLITSNFFRESKNENH